MNKQPKFKIGDWVYHVAPESDKGLILDIKYVYSSGKFEYLVSLGWADEKIVWEEELSANKTFL